MSEPKHANCSQLAATLGISHDSVNRFLLRENYEPADLYAESIKLVNPVGGTLSVDDTVLDKPYAEKMAFVGHYWSGKHHRAVKGINLITLYYVDINGCSVPVSYRIYDKADGKTKNDYFLDMLKEVLCWGLKPRFVTGDTWYSSVANMKTIKNNGLCFQFGIECNRKVSVEKGTWVQVQTLDVPPEGLRVWLNEFGYVKLFRTKLKEQIRHYVTYLPNENDYDDFKQAQFSRIHDQHWEIEQYHRTIKQVCNIERFQVRTNTPILNHIFSSLCCFVQLQKMKVAEFMSNAYQWKRELYMEIVATFTKNLAPSLAHLNTKFKGDVNA